jgi:4'-phosphopantetheinyl transferase
MSLDQFQPIVWWLRTDQLDNRCEEGLCAALDRTERARALRFISALDRREFVACHALLRIMLSRISCQPRCEWAFSLGENGKPSIAAEHGLPDLQFNITHTRGLVAASAAWRHPIGVDVQIFGSCSDALDLAERFFAVGEAGLVAAASELHRPRVFAQLWTLKEAYIKATGLGLSASLDSFVFDLEPLRVQFGREQFGREHSDSPGAWQFASSILTEQHALSVALYAPDQQSRRPKLSEISGAELQAAIAEFNSTALGGAGRSPMH